MVVVTYQQKNYYTMSKKVKQNVSVSSEKIMNSIENITNSINDDEE